ncbi:actin-like [Convolutriloba macropyga]|uniref:actin-like n=1 Tax=Convolutriloba macropyga TaxID=536237 RepID=UPI003F524497
MASVLRDMGAPSVKMVDTAEMTLHSYGLESGLVIETGYEATFVVPIWNGRSIRSAIQKIDIAGDDITMSLMNLVSNQIWYLDSKSFDYADEVKKEYCFFAEDYFSAHATPVHVTFPSDEIVTIGDAQFEAPEILFMPPLDDLAGIGLADAIYESLENVDSYMQDKILSNVVLGGGNSMLRGLKERLEHEFYEMEVSASEDREYSAWIGASKWSL